MDRSPPVPGVSAAVHYAQTQLSDLTDGMREGDYEPDVVRTVESFSVADVDASGPTRKEVARTVGGIHPGDYGQSPC